MSTGILPPAASWYMSNVLVCNDDGLLAYGSRNEIVTIRLIDKQKGLFDYACFYHAHPGRINCVIFSPSFGTYKNCLAACSEDGLIGIWESTSSELRLAHKEGQRVVSLDWSVVDPNLIVAVNESGSIICWDLPSNIFRRINIIGEKITPVCLSCCRHNSDIVALGVKTGVIFIINIKGNGKKLFRVRAHEGDVLSLSWCPVPDNIFTSDTEQNTDTTYLLASSGMDKNIYIWKAGVDMRYCSRLQLPNHSINPGFRKKSVTNEGGSSCFICVRWVDPYQILSSSLNGELLSWDLKKVIALEKSKRENGQKKVTKPVQPRLLHSIHNKGLFSIACLISSERQIDHKEEKRLVWTTSVDKHLTASYLKNGQTVLDLCCPASAIICLAVSPTDINMIAIGSGDGRIMMWNMANEAMFKDIYVHWKKINGKVMSLAWHPTEEDALAFGTSDGRVGIVTACTDKMPVILKLYHHYPVYSLVWAPPLFPIDGINKQPNLVLYAIGNKEVVQYCRELPDKDPISLESILKEADSLAGMKHSPRTEAAFKHDFSVVAVGCDNGSVHILNFANKSRMFTLFPHQKCINSLVWHPASVANDLDSPYKNWLASGSHNIKVFNIPEKPEMTVDTVATLNLHSEKVTTLVWNPHHNAQLMSASYDHTVQIWDVLTQSPLATYTKHYSTVLCATWSHLDPNIAISGSSDTTLQVWKVKDQPVVTNAAKKKECSEKLKMRSAVGHASEMVQADSRVPDWSVNLNVPQDSKEQNKGLQDYKKRVRARSFFPITALLLQQPNHLEQLFNRLILDKEDEATNTSEPSETENSKPNSSAYLDYFGDSEAMKRLLIIEDAHFKETSQHFHSQTQALWRGNVSEMIDEAIKKKQLSDWLVSLAPMASFAVWEKTCTAYIDQLIECGEYVRASSYLLALHKVEEAILLLAEHNLYKEALAIAKCRYPDDDPTISKLLYDWGCHACNNGQLPVAVHCFLACGDYQMASETLIRCKDLKSLKMAALLMEKMGLLERAQILKNDCILLGLQHDNHAIVESVVDDKPEMQHWRLWLESCRIVNSMKFNMKNFEHNQLAWLRKELQIDSLADRMKSICDKIGKRFDGLRTHVDTLKQPFSEKELWFIISGHLALFCAYYHDAGRTNFESLQQLVHALSKAYQYQTVNACGTPTLQICYFLAPRGPFSEGSIFTSALETEDEKLLMKSARAFLCAGVVHWLTNSTTMKETIFTKNVDPSDTRTQVHLDWLVELLENCQQDVLDPESFSFFKTKAQKQLLLDIVAKDKAEANKRRSIGKKLKRKSGNELNKSSSENSEHGNGNESQVDDLQNGDGENSTLNSSVVNESSNHKAEDNFGGTNGVEGNFSNNNLANLENNDNAEEILTKDNQVNSKAVKNEEIIKMDNLINIFEGRRISMPNPFVACSNIKCVISYYVKESNSDLAKVLDEKCDSMWKVCGVENA